MAFFRHTLHVVTTLLLVSVPGLIAFDCGGFLPWSHWLLSILAILLLLLVTLGESESQLDGDEPHADTTLRPYWRWLTHWTPLLLILVFAAVSMLQTWPLPAWLVRWLSPASAAAFEDWLPQAIGSAATNRFTISLAPWLTTGVTALAIILAAFAFIAGLLMKNRHFVLALLVGLAVTGLVHAAAGYYQQAVSPGVNLGGVTRIGQPFGSFVNRANAGALLNIGLAAAIGLLSARLHGRWDYPRTRQPGLHGSFRRMIGDRFQSILNDRVSLLISVGIVFIVSAILVCGSRGALVGLVAGAIACAVCGVSTQKFPVVIVTSVGVALVALMTLGKTGMEATSLERFLETSETMTIDNGRLQHWPDGLRAGTASLPLGGGLGAYRYVYLPFQETGGSSWYQNADNQWVQWYTEGGLPITAAILLALLSALFALRRLLEASDPVNRGLAIAGVFAIAAIGISQTFDFALTASSIALAATLLAAAVHARAAQAVSPSATRPSFGQAPFVRYRFVRIVFALVFLGMLVWANQQTRRDAMADAVVRRCKLQLADPALDYSILLELEQQVDRAIERVPDDETLLVSQIEVQRRLFRIERIARLLAQQPISDREAVRRTNVNLVRVNQPLLGNPPLSEELRLQRIAELSRHALQLCPFSEVPLWNLAQLDFSAGHPSRTPILLDQLSRLRCRNSEVLLGIATTAWQFGETAIAVRVWKQLLMVDPRKLPTVYRQILKTDGKVRLSDILPDEPRSDQRTTSQYRQLLIHAAKLQSQLPAEQQDPLVRRRALDLLSLPISPQERELKRELEKE